MWILPTYKRPQRLKLTLESLKRCAISTPGIVVIDGDSTGYEDIEKWLPSGWGYASMPENVGYIEIIKQVLQHYPDKPWYGWFTDDMIAETENFDKLLLDQAIPPLLMVSTNDGWQAPKRIHGAAIFEGNLYRYVMARFPDIRHSCYDDIWEAVGNDLHIWHTDMGIMCRHIHPWKNNQEMDETYKHNYSTLNADVEAFNQWKADVYPAIIEEIRKHIG